MDFSSPEIDINLCAADIVRQHFRTAEVFRKYGIAYCCGSKFPLKMALETSEFHKEQVLNELKQATQVIQLPANLPFQEWKSDFLADYITQVNHQYLRQYLPIIRDHLDNFVNEHWKKFPYLPELMEQFDLLYNGMFPHMQEEEETIFPYIRQISHAYTNNESYASLLVRTLRKPVEDIMKKEHDSMEVSLNRMRNLTNHYSLTENACISHRVCFGFLQELDNDLVHHLYLENEILFPRVIAMEKELLRIK